jgi:hypothetical protein
MNEKSTGELHGEVQWVITLTDPPRHMHRGRHNLLSAKGKTDVARALGNFGGWPDVDWNSLVEQAFELVTRAHREGTPLVDAGDGDEPEAALYRLDPLIVDGQANLIFGPGGNGKSYITMLASVLVQTGQHSLGFSPEPGRVLYLDYETDEAVFKRRLGGIARGFGLEERPHLLYRRMESTISGELATLQRIVAEKVIQLVIVDSALYACGGEPENAAVTGAYFNALRSLGCTTLTIAHTPNAERKAFGSVFWQNAPRNVWEVRGVPDTERGIINVGLFHRKSNDEGLRRPIGIEIAFREISGEKSVAFGRAELMDDPELAAGVSLRERITHLLKRGALTPVEIVDTLEAPDSSVRVTLSRGENKSFVRLGPKWGLSK